MGLFIEVAACVNIGGRPNNEDNFYINGVYLQRQQMNAGGRLSQKNRNRLQVYAVFDGMGGGEYGEYASECAAARLKAYQADCAHVTHGANLQKLLQDTSEEINATAMSTGLPSGACGTTAALLLLEDGYFRTAHVGDSRIYLLRGGTLRRVTKDQSEVQRLLDAEKITPEEAFTHPRKNVITHHLGMPLRNGRLASQIGLRERLVREDLFLLCSDGISDSLRDEEVQALLSEDKSAMDIARSLVRAAIHSASSLQVESDNVTALILKVRRVPPAKADRRRLCRLRLGQWLLVPLSCLFMSGAVYALLRLLQCL